VNLKVINTKNSSDYALKCNQERVDNISKGSEIIIGIFIASLVYSLGFLFKYYQTTLFQSIVLSLIISTIFTCMAGCLLGKYYTSKSNTKLKKEFDK
jgi:phosphate/sulfate permease